MTTEEYKNEMKFLELEFETKKKALNRKCAIENNPYKIGDIVTDHVGSIKIERIQITFSAFGCLPQCVYTGIELKKDGTPMKRQEKRPVYQNNILPKIETR